MFSSFTGQMLSFQQNMPYLLFPLISLHCCRLVLEYRYHWKCRLDTWRRGFWKGWVSTFNGQNSFCVIKVSGVWLCFGKDLKDNKGRKERGRRKKDKENKEKRKEKKETYRVNKKTPVFKEKNRRSDNRMEKYFSGKCLWKNFLYHANLGHRFMNLTSKWSSTEDGAFRKARKEFWESWCLTPDNKSVSGWVSQWNIHSAHTYYYYSQIFYLELRQIDVCANFFWITMSVQCRVPSKSIGTARPDPLFFCYILNTFWDQKMIMRWNRPELQLSVPDIYSWIC